jgi:SAM-dependent methyltransferase
VVENRGEETRGEVRIHHADVCDLPFPDSHFGLVVADGNLLSLVPEPGRALKEMWRVLRRGGGILAAANGLYGVFLLSLAERRGLEECTEIYRSRRAKLDGLDFRLYVPGELGELFRRAEFRRVSVRADAVTFCLRSDRELAEILRRREVFKRVIT